MGLSDTLWGTMGWGSKTFGLFSGGTGERFAVSCLPVVVVMQAAQQWVRDDLPTRLWLVWSLWLAGNTLLYPLVWSGMVEVRLVLLHHPVQVSLAQDETKLC
jgi:hypothetical protein